MLSGCQRDQGVQAGFEQGQTGTYQPRPAPKTDTQQSQEMTGELQRIDMAAKTISIRVDNGMEQTFKFDDNTMVMGLQGQLQPKTQTTSVRNLLGKEGSEVTVHWRDENGVKVATHVTVTQVSTSKSKAGKGKTK
jgi:hypothetical protein